MRHAAGSALRLGGVVARRGGTPVEGIRSRGFAINLAQNQPNVSAIGAAVLDEHNQAIGAVTISAPSDRLSEATCLELGPAVSDAARRITLGMRLRR